MKKWVTYAISVIMIGIFIYASFNQSEDRHELPESFQEQIQHQRL